MSEPLTVEVLTEFAENVSYADGEESRAMANELLVLRPRLAALEVERDSLARSLTAERFAALELEAAHLRARVGELTRPHRIETGIELEALSAGTVIRAADGRIWERTTVPGKAWAYGCGGGYVVESGSDGVISHGPATVVGPAPAMEPRRFEDSVELDAAAPIDAIGIDERGRAWQRVSRWPGDETGCWALANLSMTEPDSSDLLTEHGTITLIHAPKDSW